MALTKIRKLKNGHNYYYKGNELDQYKDIVIDIIESLHEKNK